MRERKDATPTNETAEKYSERFRHKSFAPGRCSKINTRRRDGFNVIAKVSRCCDLCCGVKPRHSQDYTGEMILLPYYFALQHQRAENIRPLR
jgi:hypothetical protein